MELGRVHVELEAVARSQQNGAAHDGLGRDELRGKAIGARAERGQLSASD
jgi:hypothetical protein